MKHGIVATTGTMQEHNTYVRRLAMWMKGAGSASQRKTSRQGRGIFPTLSPLAQLGLYATQLLLLAFAVWSLARAEWLRPHAGRRDSWGVRALRAFVLGQPCLPVTGGVGANATIVHASLGGRHTSQDKTLPTAVIGKEAGPALRAGVVEGKGGKPRRRHAGDGGAGGGAGGGGHGTTSDGGAGKGSVCASGDAKDASTGVDVVLLLCVAGLLCIYVGWGVLQELVMTRTFVQPASNEVDEEGTTHPGEKFTYSQFVVLLNRSVALVMSLGIVWYQSASLPAHTIPLYKYSLCSISNTISSFCQYEALRYVRVRPL